MPRKKKKKPLTQEEIEELYPNEKNIGDYSSITLKDFLIFSVAVIAIVAFFKKTGSFEGIDFDSLVVFELSTPVGATGRR